MPIDPKTKKCLTSAPSTLRELLGGAAVVTRTLTLGEGLPPERAEAAWGPLAGHAVAIRALPAGTHVECVAAALAFLVEERKMDRDDVYGGLGSSAVDLEYKVQVLARALVVADGKGTTPWAESAAEVRALLPSADHVSWLYERHLEWQRERSPYDTLRDDAAIQEVAVALGKGYRSPTSLNGYDAATLRSIVTALADLHSKLTMQLSSAMNSADASTSLTPTES